MIFHKSLLKPAATDVSVELVDADNQVGIIVSWAGCRAAQMFPIEGFSRDAARAWFQRWADDNAEVVAHALGKQRRELEEREAERLDERLDPALQREGNLDH